MRKTKILILTTLMIINSLLISGCNTDFSLWEITFGTGSNEIIGTMTLGEYDNKVNRILTTVFNDGETILANSKYVISNTRDVNAEYTLLQTSINNVQNAYDQIDAIAEPSRRTENKTSTLLALTNYKNSLIEYGVTLQSNNIEEITKAAADVMVNLETLQGEWTTITE